MIRANAVVIVAVIGAFTAGCQNSGSGGGGNNNNVKKPAAPVYAGVPANQLAWQNSQNSNGVDPALSGTSADSTIQPRTVRTSSIDSLSVSDASLTSASAGGIMTSGGNDPLTQEYINAYKIAVVPGNPDYYVPPAGIAAPAYTATSTSSVAAAVPPAAPLASSTASNPTVSTTTTANTSNGPMVTTTKKDSNGNVVTVTQPAANPHEVNVDLGPQAPAASGNSSPSTSSQGATGNQADGAGQGAHGSAGSQDAQVTPPSTNGGQAAVAPPAHPPSQGTDPALDSTPSAPPPVSAAGSITQFPVTAAVTTTKHQATSDDWQPGLPHEPLAAPILTRGIDGGASGPVAWYTDSKADDLMNNLKNILYNTDSDSLKGNLAFAGEITDVRLSHSASKQFTLKVSVNEDGKNLSLELNGTDDGSGKVKLTEVLPSSNSAQPKYVYGGYVYCMDTPGKNYSCENADVLLKRNLAANSQAEDHAYLVHRHGSAIVTLGKAPSKSERPDLTSLYRYLNDSIIGICLREKADPKFASVVTALNKVCPAKTKKPTDGANRVSMSTWSVAGGMAGYEIVFNDDAAKSNGGKNKLVLTGQLVTFKKSSDSNSATVKQDEPVQVDDRNGKHGWIRSAVVHANDGGGDLNFEFSFVGTQNKLRASVSSNFHETAAPQDSDGATSQKSTPPAAAPQAPVNTDQNKAGGNGAQSPPDSSGVNI